MESGFRITVIQFLLGLAVMAMGVGIYLTPSAKSCVPVASPELRAYLEVKAAEASSRQCDEAPKLLWRVAAIKGRLGEIEDFKQRSRDIESRREMQGKFGPPWVTGENRDLESVRRYEKARLRAELIKICIDSPTTGGKSDWDEPPAPDRSRSGSAKTSRE